MLRTLCNCEYKTRPKVVHVGEHPIAWKGQGERATRVRRLLNQCVLARRRWETFASCLPHRARHVDLARLVQEATSFSPCLA